MTEPITQKESGRALDHYMLILGANTKRLRMERNFSQMELGYWMNSPSCLAISLHHRLYVSQAQRASRCT